MGRAAQCICPYTDAAEIHRATRVLMCLVAVKASCGRAQGHRRRCVCTSSTLTYCDRPDVASRHGHTIVAAQRTHASIILQLSGSAQDAGPHALWAWRILHVAERKGVNVCAKVDILTSHDLLNVANCDRLDVANWHSRTVAAAHRTHVSTCMRCWVGGCSAWQSVRARMCLKRWHTHFLRSSRFCE